MINWQSPATVDWYIYYNFSNYFEHGRDYSLRNLRYVTAVVSKILQNYVKWWWCDSCSIYSLQSTVYSVLQVQTIFYMPTFFYSNLYCKNFYLFKLRFCFISPLVTTVSIVKNNILNAQGVGRWIWKILKMCDCCRARIFQYSLLQVYNMVVKPNYAIYLWI